MNKQELKSLLASDNIPLVLDVLLELAPGIDSDLHDETVQVSARYAGYQKDLHAGTQSRENLELTINNIRASLNYLVGLMPDGEYAVSEAIAASFRLPGSGSPVPPAAVPGLSSTVPNSALAGQNHGGKTVSQIPWIVGLCLLLAGILFLLVENCPTEPQFFGIRLLLALGAGGLATIIPGMLNMENAGVTAGGALGLAVLIYLVNPARLIVSDDCGNRSFDFTVSLQIDKSLKIPATYPALGNSILQLHLGNEWKPDTLDARGDADFKNIAGDYRNQKVAALLVARYWELQTDSVVLSGKNQVIMARPNGSLGKIRGKVMDDQIGAPVPDATIEVLGETTQSNATGNFELNIPLEKQLTFDYEVNVYKDGFLPWKGNATPATGVPVNILLAKQKK